METSNKIIAIESIAIILLCLLLFNKCNQKSEPIIKTKTLTKTEYIYQTKWDTITLHHYHKQDSEIVYFEPSKVDTEAVIKNYFKQFTFVDSLRDSNIAVQSRIKVALNTVLESKLTYKLLKPNVSTTITIENTTEQPKRPLLLIGATLGGNKTEFINTITPNLIFVTKSRKAFGLGYNLVNKSYQASVYLPIYK